eukprot:CAMPEP_0170518976 /NCGR_PEP_ID=MMETSP0209-20121228/4541_1 /TAXON_ID=665100 ORGANISM="Litonotus pictus, Strain P1" /NCGR_SAMPLE_ID=MMETSP0209 /ASSEMBLY_ACC=CAM_ASM_000301 /LENGTH=61 /DNA_ID=CAMNT_0010804731 /DNA_START=883 /DNA_END=1068 /DNA_ORIENTATION=-
MAVVSSCLKVWCLVAERAQPQYWHSPGLGRGQVNMVFIDWATHALHWLRQRVASWQQVASL